MDSMKPSNCHIKIIKK